VQYIWDFYPTIPFRVHTAYNQTKSDKGFYLILCDVSSNWNLNYKPLLLRTHR